MMRCRPWSPRARNYSKKGIVVCDRWKEFINFYEDIGKYLTPGMTLDRINNSLGYFKENCRWATVEENVNNRACSILITSAGKTLPISKWSKITGIKEITIQHRFKAGWDHDKIINTPVDKTRWTRKYIELHGN